MSRACRICLNEVSTGDQYHPRCLRALFGTTKIPRLDIEIGKLHTAALAMIGHASLSGIQKKISVSLATKRETLQVMAEGGNYVLKPQTDTYPALPENEHVTTRLARLVDIEVTPCGLLSLKDGSLAYILRRFDRLPNGKKLQQEDFCQLSLKSPKEKYDGTAELCVGLLRKYASETLIEILKLYRQLLFAWWSFNGDMHLKNFSLLTDKQRYTRLTPAYDLACTRLVIPNDTSLALPIQGKKDNLKRRTWLAFAEYCELPEKTAQRVLENQSSVLDQAVALIERSFLPPVQKEQYQQYVSERSAQLLQ